MKKYHKNLQFPSSLEILDPKISKRIKMCINLKCNMMSLIVQISVSGSASNNSQINTGIHIS